MVSFLSELNKKVMRKFRYLFIVFFIQFYIVSCDLFQSEPPTKELMEGVWEVTSVKTSDGREIIDKVRLVISAFYLASDNTVLSTAGPLMMYIVYGENNYSQITGKLDQVFNYATLNLNGGEFFIGGGTQSTFTLEMKIEGIGGTQTLETLLSLMNIHPTFRVPVVYHKFMDVKVSFENKHQKMIWQFDNSTHAVYNTKDQYGNYVLWQGYPVENFQRCTITLEKRTKDIRDLVRDAYNQR